MKALIQRVKNASVEVNGQIVGAIDEGILLLLGVEKDDDQLVSDRMLKKILAYRIFDDENGRMGRSLADINGGLLVVSQFTLVADTKKGTKPSFSSAAPPEHGELIYNHFVAQAYESHQNIATGQFGADMQVSLLNDGPVTFMLEL
ncbi:D-tyrosyl-tRNA(Tyr) deacylase [Oleiphilus sp. HI0009]|uniref:D-aminoacyl-tRNA deacylase n=1 Tax=unclassified Oleiphilus TaxID=2631174 RepID=UPI0007C2C946|nr:MULTISPECIES: D-aminoacyl-tRNA deacylase [unclassified Oleiphilus]KZX84189.1 D-tyrosyl-tRNA(Tyr) deacylase [Oleiphilus sp. HI0009]MCH2158827.1 D-aminoacyl-tRNA deacylase [Oleiphilaceae bacterium]KZY64166.1 D-tyrosyl-tRNA(Tyr) deacylase [Oleiphilus sp. HI0066]KZY66636.1 D-tyrosyl-tRNA(Tyr) deacylase [Oleiphilus sp. HI0066]KZY70327.1 D-tyrosyl-tRNA(Tyr) deacylase [Oleiphilus sp. HI0067]